MGSRKTMEADHRQLVLGSSGELKVGSFVSIARVVYLPLRPHVMNLLHPCDTIMDLNIGTPIWLAARAEGMLYPSSDGAYYKSRARIVFVGHGADEQCVGYSRHRTK